MPVRKDKDGYRYVEAEVEVPGSPDEVWQAIATGKGISSWFVPTTVDERAGGETVSRFGPGMDAVSKITRWDPPRRYVAESNESDDAEAGEPGAGPGTVATEWIVEARTGDTCVVRVVHRWFSETDEWDAEFEGHAYGWASSFFRMLNLYLTHFAGRDCSAFDLSAFSASPPAETWHRLISAFRLDPVTQRVESIGDAPELAGTVVSTEVTDPELLAVRERSPIVRAAREGLNGENPELLVLLNTPAPGFAHFFIMPMGEQTMVSVRFYLYGESGAGIASGTERKWNDWLTSRC